MMLLPIVFLVLLAILWYFCCLLSVHCVLSFYIYHRDYWKRKGIPGPAPSLFTGNFQDLVDYRNPNVIQLSEWTKVLECFIKHIFLQKYGKVYGIQEGIRKVLVVSDVKMLQEIFVKNFDCFHSRKVSFSDS